MNLTIRALPAVSALCLAAAAHAQLPRAGCDGWSNIAGLTLKGANAAGGLNGVFSETLDTKTGRHVARRGYAGFAEAEGFDGALGWTQDRSGASHFLDSRWGQAISVTEAWLRKRGWCEGAARGAAIAQLPDENRSGAKLAVWQVTPQGGIPALLRFEPSGGVLAETEVRLWGNRLIRHYEDWRDIGHGVRIPFIERDEDPEDEGTETITIASATARREPIDSAVFAKPGRTHDYGISGGGPAATVPYEDDGIGRIFVPVTIDGKGPFPFEIDTGGHFILMGATADVLGLRAAGAFNATGGGTGIVKEGIVRTHEVHIGTAVLRDQPAKVIGSSKAGNDRGAKAPRAGILGLELFERFAVSLDRHAKTATLTPLETFKPPARGIALPICFTEDAPITAGSFADLPGDFELDSGDAGPAIIEGYWGQQRGLESQLSQGITWSGGGIGGDYRETLSRGDLTLGPLKLPREVVSYVGVPERGSEATRMQAGVVGESSLYRFDMTYDYGHGRVWIDPQTDIQVRAFNRAGLRLKKTADGFDVAMVVPKSPAADAGLAAGDHVVSIGESPTRDMAGANAAILFSGPIDSDLALSVAPKAGGAARTVILRLKEILP